MSSFDIDNIVKLLVNEYLHPKYPLYRIKYIDSFTDYNNIDEDTGHGTLVNKIVTRIMECKELPSGEKIRIGVDGHFISPSSVNDFEKHKIFIDTYYNEHIIIIDMERIA